MVDVVVGTNESHGIVAVVLYWDTDAEPCPALSPTGISCAYPADHDGDWHMGFPGDKPGLMPVKWQGGFVV